MQQTIGKSVYRNYIYSPWNQLFAPEAAKKNCSPFSIRFSMARIRCQPKKLSSLNSSNFTAHRCVFSGLCHSTAKGVVEEPRRSWVESHLLRNDPGQQPKKGNHIEHLLIQNKNPKEQREAPVFSIDFRNFLTGMSGFNSPTLGDGWILLDNLQFLFNACPSEKKTSSPQTPQRIKTNHTLWATNA